MNLKYIYEKKYKMLNKKITFDLRLMSLHFFLFMKQSIWADILKRFSWNLAGFEFFSTLKKLF